VCWGATTRGWSDSEPSGRERRREATVGSGSVTRLVLIRHGESTATVNRTIGGWRTCTGLSPLGRQQAERLRDRWAAQDQFTADVLIASQYARAIETAEIIAPGIGGLDVVADEGFGEHDPGPDCDGLPYTEFLEKFDISPDVWDSGDPFATTFPGGETIAAFHYRVGTAVRRIIDQYAAKTVVIVCHGGVVDAAMRLALRAPSVGGFQIHTLNTSITDLELIKPSLWRLNRYNDTGHLVGLPSHTNPPFADRA
jgi:probable phosphoglycerate mutase